MMWSTHSGRIDPISCSTKPFCQGEVGGLVPDAHGTQSACDHRTVNAIPVPDHVARSLVPGECLCTFLRNHAPNIAPSLTWRPTPLGHVFGDTPPIATKTGPVPTRERLGPNDCENPQDC